MTANWGACIAANEIDDVDKSTSIAGRAAH
jgi:hypothetical protein